jgi:uncharacterized protein
MPEKTCPVCGKRSSPREAPFCGRRCADIDLGRWLIGAYVLPGESAAAEQPDEDQYEKPE